MRALPRLAVVSGFALALAAASAARAEYLKFNGTHAIRFSHNGVIREVSKSGTGYALVNRAGSSTKLNTLEFVTGPFATISSTFLGSESGTMGTSVFFNEVPELRFEGVRIDPNRAGKKGLPGVFKPIHGALAASMGMLSFNTLPAKGIVRLCFAVACTGSTLAVSLNQTETTLPGMSMYAIGPGVGGAFTVQGIPAKVSVVGSPWTIRTASKTYKKKGGVGVLTGMGFAKGPPGTPNEPGSMLGTTLANGFVGGRVQLVTPIQTTCVGSCESFNSPAAQIARLTLTFQPEPGSFVSLCAGAIMLALLGRRRVGR